VRACAQTTLQLSPLLVSKLNQLGADLYGINGQDNVPTSTTAFLERLRVIITGARARAHAPNRKVYNAACICDTLEW
jgi:hypothetical protein